MLLVMCADFRVRIAQAVDHIVPKSAGGTDGAAKLQALCHQYHAMKTAKEGAGGWSHERDSYGSRLSLLKAHSQHP